MTPPTSPAGIDRSWDSYRPFFLTALGALAQQSPIHGYDAQCRAEAIQAIVQSATELADAAFLKLREEPQIPAQAPD